jgi:hypothetical protein
MTQRKHTSIHTESDGTTKDSRSFSMGQANLKFEVTREADFGPFNDGQFLFSASARYFPYGTTTEAGALLSLTYCNRTSDINYDILAGVTTASHLLRFLSAVR